MHIAYMHSGTGLRADLQIVPFLMKVDMQNKNCLHKLLYRESLLIAILFIADLLIADFFQVSSPSLSRHNFVHRGFFPQSPNPSSLTFVKKSQIGCDTKLIELSEHKIGVWAY